MFKLKICHLGIVYKAILEFPFVLYAHLIGLFDLFFQLVQSPDKANEEYTANVIYRRHFVFLYVTLISAIMHPCATGRQYDAIAPWWDEKRRASPHGVRLLKRAIALCRLRNRALDVGCGTGGPMTERLIIAGFQVAALDVSAGMLEIAKAKYSCVEFIHGDITEWKTLLRFDLILAWDSIFHLPYGSHVPVIKKLCGYLTEGGVLLFTAGGVDAEIVGKRHGREFHYSSLSDTVLVELIKKEGCVPVLMESEINTRFITW